MLFPRHALLLRPVPLSLGSALLSCLVMGPVQAADTPTLATVKVTATAEPEKAREVSVEAIQRTQAKDMAEVFSGEPAVSVGGGSRAAQRIYLRGIEGTNLAITIDGATQGRSLFQHRGDIGGIDPELLKRVEIQTASAADQGASALGGSLKFETLDAQDLLEGPDRFGATLRTSYSSASNGQRAAATFYGLATQHLGVLLHASGENAHEYTSGDGSRVRGTGSDTRELFLKMSLLDAGPHSLRLSAERNHDHGDYIFKADTTYSPTAALEPQVGERTTYTADYRYRPEGSRWADLEVNAYSNKRSLEWRNSGNLIYDKTLGGDIHNTFRFDIGATRSRLTVGLDYLDGNGAYVNGSTGAKYGVGDIKSENLGLYLQERLEVGPLAVSLGARRDRYESYYGATPVKGSELSPNARVQVGLGHGFSVLAGYSEAVRATSVVPIAWFGYTVENPTFNQKSGKDSYGKAFMPESSTQREAGLTYEAKGFFAAGDTFTAQATTFRTRLLNLIQQVNAGSATVIGGFYNDDPVQSQGYELRAAWRKGAIQASAAFIHADLTDKTGATYTLTRRVAAPSGDRFNADVHWQATSTLGLGYTLTAVSGLDNASTPLPGYTVHGVQAQWQATRRLNLDLAVRNLGDKYYSDQTSTQVGMPEPGRDVRVSAAYRF
nr:TonB-dependent receptor plug domain-containing protein [uncultured Holophaga sp.]